MRHDTPSFPYPVPKELAAKFEQDGFSHVWARSYPYWARRHGYLDPKSGEPTWDEPFCFGILSHWLCEIRDLINLLEELVPVGDGELALIVALYRALADMEYLCEFMTATWMHDPMMRAQMIGQPPEISPDGPVLRVVSVEQGV